MPKFQGYRDSTSTATLLNDGRVLFTGGRFDNGTTEIYDPNLNKFTKTADMNISRQRHSAILLSDGNVLITGGLLKNDNKPSKKLKSAEIYDVKENKFISVGDMINPKSSHKMFLLDNGNVIVVDSSLKEIELFDVKTKTFSKTDKMKINNSIEETWIRQYFYISKDKVLFVLSTKNMPKINIAIMDLNNFSIDIFPTNIPRNIATEASSCIALLNQKEILFARDTTFDQIHQIFKMPILNISDMTIREIKAFGKKDYIKPSTAINLDDGNVILIGNSTYRLDIFGLYECGKVIKNTKLYIASQNKIIDFKNTIYKRVSPQYVRLKNGNYIIYGGYYNSFNTYNNNLQPELLVVKK